MGPGLGSTNPLVGSKGALGILLGAVPLVLQEDHPWCQWVQLLMYAGGEAIELGQEYLFCGQLAAHAVENGSANCNVAGELNERLTEIICR